jgi:hypothetical protein
MVKTRRCAYMGPALLDIFLINSQKVAMLWLPNKYQLIKVRFKSLKLDVHSHTYYRIKIAF